MRALLIAASLVAVLALAVALRFVDLDANPGGLFGDEAAEGLSAQRILHDPGYRPIFIADGGGREALFAYVVALGFGIFGESALVLRAVAAAFGVAGVAAIWVLARRFGAVTGLVAAAWAAGSLWLICISRDGMRNTIVPLFEGLALAALLAWHDRPTRSMAVVAGAALALASLYTYQPLKLLPLLVIAWLAWLRYRNRPAYDRLRPTFLPGAVSFLLVGAPMIAYAIAEPASYFGRALSVSAAADPPADLLTHWTRTLGMFVLNGDPNPRHNVAMLPLLGIPLTVIALVGLARLWRRRADPAHALILWSLPIFLLPPMLATEGAAPHFLRSLGLAAPLAVTIGLGVTELFDGAARRYGSWAARAVAAGATIGLLALAIGSGRAYLSRPMADRYEAYSYDVVAMAEAAGVHDVVLLDPYTAGVVEFLDSPDPPRFADPRIPLSTLPPGRVLALTLSDLAVSVGDDAAGQAVVIAMDPSGDPAVWAVATADIPR